MLVQVLPEADSAAGLLGSGGWTSALPEPGGNADLCGDGLGGLAADVMRFIRPLEELLEDVTGDPAALYQASHTWETYAGSVQTVSDTLISAIQVIRGAVQGALARAVEHALETMGSAVHSIADWSKVMSQTMQLCVRAVEIMRSLVCAGFQMIASFAGLVGDVLFGSWPWEWDKKAEAVQQFADNCREVIDEVVSNVDRALQAFCEMIRLLTDLYRAIVPFHAELEALLGAVLQAYPPGTLLGPLGGMPGQIPPGHLGDVYNPSTTPYPGSDHSFTREYDLGYSHQFDLGPTDMTTEELNEMFREQFGHVFVPSRVADNSQLNSQLTGVDQVIGTSLFGLEIPGATSGGIVVTGLHDDGFVISAQEGHPEYPGEVAFRLHVVDGNAVFEVSAAYDETILDGMGFGGNTNPAFAGITDSGIWADTSYRIQDMMNYGN